MMLHLSVHSLCHSLTYTHRTYWSKLMMLFLEPWVSYFPRFSSMPATIEGDSQLIHVKNVGNLRLDRGVWMPSGPINMDAACFVVWGDYLNVSMLHTRFHVENVGHFKSITNNARFTTQSIKSYVQWDSIEFPTKVHHMTQLRRTTHEWLFPVMLLTWN